MRRRGSFWWLRSGVDRARTTVEESADLRLRHRDGIRRPGVFADGEAAAGHLLSMLARPFEPVDGAANAFAAVIAVVGRLPADIVDRVAVRPGHLDAGAFVESRAAATSDGAVDADMAVPVDDDSSSALTDQPSQYAVGSESDL